MYAYREAAPEKCPNAGVAFRTADLACGILGLEGLRVRFFLPASDRHAKGDAAMDDLGRLLGDWDGHALANETDAAGLTYGSEDGTVWVRADMDLGETITTVLHEAKHASDYRTRGPVQTIKDRNQREHDAVEFSETWTRRILT